MIPPEHGVQDAELFRLTMAVVAEMDRKSEEYLVRDGYKYVPKRKERSVSAFDSGWPSVGDPIADSNSEVIAFGELFANERSAIYPIAYSDLESFAPFLTYIENNVELLLRVEVPSAKNGRPDIRRELFEFVARSLPHSVFDRTKSLGLKLSDPKVVELYKLRERSWLASALRSQLVVPLVLADFDVEGTFRIDERTSLHRLSDDDIRAMAQGYNVSGVPNVVANAARFALFFDIDPVENSGEGARMFSDSGQADTSDVETILEAMRIVTEAPLGWARVFRKPVDWSQSWKGALPEYILDQTLRRYPVEFDNYGWLRAARTITFDELQRIPGVVAALKNSPARVKLAARRLSIASVRDSSDDQVVDACIGIEALLGQKGAEMSYRIALRAAILLATRETDPLSAKNVLKMVKVVYNRRSEIVHGSTSGKSEVLILDDNTPLATSELAVALLRVVLLEILLREGSTAVEDLDAVMLERMNAFTPESE